MSNLTNEIVLRPRFQLHYNAEINELQSAFHNKAKEPFTLKTIDEHVYLGFIKSERTFWSPQLHLELTSFEKGKSSIHGVFGPNPTLWTFFMFLHFGVATFFIILGIFAYSKHALGHTITGLVIGMIVMLLLWIALYVFGRLGKKKGKPQMQQLYNYLEELLEGYKKSAAN
ncbi:hypothetical protein GCM10011414_00530 [Croceivirga lutea]|uniref:GTP-binding protein n=1 Tax=Croceivirga lutea TaxID=1775167 RepID=UPI00163A91B2|nr:GTP-binding protein [Croceivirga lutea]GGG35025.1 hypothetical protein GCM10011414_00530 [Croceivirga lutea]